MKLGPCKTCACYTKSPTALNQGYCLRFPPVPVLRPVEGGGAVTVFGPPTVKSDHVGCFEHVPIEEKLKQTAKDELLRKFGS